MAVDSGLTSAMKSFAVLSGADLVGVAPVERFAGASEKYRPERVLPGTRSVVSVAVRHLHGILAPQEGRVEHYPYQLFGYGWLSNIRLNWIAFELARWLEDRGFITCPYPSFFQGVGAALSHRHAAVAAGLAVFGWHNLAMTPRFGTKQRFVTVLTSAELEADPMLAGDLCDRCMRCVDACPAGAISRDESVTFEIAGRTVEMAALDRAKCGPCHAGRGGWFEHSYPDFVTFSPGGHCGLCLARCPKGEYRPA